MKVKFEGFDVIKKTWTFGGHAEAIKTIAKYEDFRKELKRHKIGIKVFLKNGSLFHDKSNDSIVVKIGKAFGVQDYPVCTINGNSIVSELEPTDRERLLIEAEKWEGPEYSVEVCRKYFHVCRNNGAHHRGDAGHLGGYATFVGKFDCNGERVDPRA